MSVEDEIWKKRYSGTAADTSVLLVRGPQGEQAVDQVGVVFKYPLGAACKGLLLWSFL